ncbi:DUF4912 domain-containing protein [Nodosilinea sp. LEGE 06152]|uniref:DUF4912 domain-containing protein n=1 Tax=Nodosilinea sp. LEGE 06152 TaxID=2777966 RepID=UPI0018806D35|nr:DUF4912 domain-containing protein [Nodosilinea sp. LEGE 06152]MBE9156089.1 DUF4912 domain-containing protein [Nodosilinea sp. LEGE 06152]
MAPRSLAWAFSLAQAGVLLVTATIYPTTERALTQGDRLPAVLSIGIELPAEVPCCSRAFSESVAAERLGLGQLGNKVLDLAVSTVIPPAVAASTPPAIASQESAATASPAPETAPFWWLLGIPALGGLLWWLLSDKGAPIAAASASPLAAAADLPSRIVLTPRTCRRAYAYWEVADEVQAEARDRGGRDLMLRLYDVSNRDADRHPPARIEQYPVSEDRQDLHLPIPQGDRDYQVELGYITGENHWLPLAKSAPVRVPACLPGEDAGTAIPAAVSAPELTTAAPMPLAEAAVAGLVGIAAAPALVVPPLSEDAVEDGDADAGPALCAIETVTVHSHRNAVSLHGGQMQYLQDQVAATYSLDPGSYILRIKAGAFSYGDDSQSGEPLVLLWIYGGRVSNLKTNVWVNGTWSTLNGYADTLSLEVDEPAHLCAFFIDTFPDNNTSAVTLSVIRL